MKMNVPRLYEMRLSTSAGCDLLSSGRAYFMCWPHFATCWPTNDHTLVMMMIRPFNYVMELISRNDSLDRPTIALNGPQPLTN